MAQLRAWVNARYSITGYHITKFREACYSFPLYRGLDDKLTLSVSCFCLNIACTVARDLLWVLSLFEVVFKLFSCQKNFTINFVTFQCNAVMSLKYGSEEKGSSLRRFSILLGLLCQKNKRGCVLNFYQKIKSETS